MPELHNARLVDGRIVDLVVVDGLIATVRDIAGRSPDATPDHDLGGWLVLPAMAEPHAHLDKALTAELVPNPQGDLMGAIGAWTQASRDGRLADADIADRASDALGRLAVRGVTAVRSHVNVGGSTGVAAIAGVREAATAHDGVIDVELVALMHSPLAGQGSSDNRQALDRAVEAGVDLIGGCPHLEPEPAAMIDHVLTVADDAGLPIDLHVDETLDPDMMTLELLAHAVLDRGFERGVTASHCVSLGMQSPSRQIEIATKVAEAGIAVVALPQTNLFLQGRDHPSATPRGLTAIAALVEAGATVCAGADNVQDPFNLMGRSDPLETAALLVMAAHTSPEVAYAMVSEHACAAMGRSRPGVEVGDVADLFAVDAPSLRAALAEAPMARRTIRRGTVVATADASSQIL